MIKLKKKEKKKQIIYHGKDIENIREDQIELIQNKGKENQLLFVDLNKKGKAYTLTYDTSKYQVLSDFLKMPIDRETFGSILNSILTLLKNLEELGFRESAIIFDIDYVMINNLAKKSLYFIYLPVKNLENGTNTKQLLMQLVQKVIVDDNDTEYIRELISVLKQNNHLPNQILKKYTQTLLTEQSFGNRIVYCKKCHSQIRKGEVRCSYCGTRVSGFEELATDEGIKLNRLRDDETDPTIAIMNNSPIGECDEPTTRAVIRQNSVNWYIIRISTGEKKLIKKSSFLIGRKSHCDYVVKDKTDISREHATIFLEDNKCYIQDEDSTYGTFVDGEKLMSGVKKKIGPGVIIRLSEEEFKISYEEEQ